MYVPYEFRPVHNSMTFSLNLAKFAVEMPVYKGRLYAKFEKIAPAIPEIQACKNSLSFLVFFSCYYSFCTLAKNLPQNK